MKDVTNMRVIYLKGMLFLLAGIISSIIILIEHPTLKMAVLLILSIWSFARFYYFVFYVIEHYVDNKYKFSGLWSFVRYLCGRNKSLLNK